MVELLHLGILESGILYQFLFEFPLKEKDDFWNFTNHKKLA